ncbi:ATP-binding cassette domain-containing protein [Streptococcus orisratti]|uniref:ATP-binding cassette domain-containing protein n=1 Tax=Streptococcus orisratti TaxID=114652 RepID=UPI003CFFA349
MTREFKDILNTQIVNNGENISGGQKIRLEIARFLLRNKEFLLVDEVTASLDKKNAHAIHEMLFSLPITLVEIAHHIENEADYDYICQL